MESDSQILLPWGSVLWHWQSFAKNCVYYFVTWESSPTCRKCSSNYVQTLTRFICLILGKMGRVFLEHIGGSRIFSCASCDTVLTNRSELISTRFTGATGRAFLFNRVVNLSYRWVMFSPNQRETPWKIWDYGSCLERCKSQSTLGHSKRESDKKGTGLACRLLKSSNKIFVLCFLYVVQRWSLEMMKKS